MWPLVVPFLRKFWWVAALAFAAAAVAGYVKHLQSENERLVVERNNAEAEADSVKVKYHNDSVVVVGILGVTRTELVGLRKQLKLAGTTKTVTTIEAQPQAVDTTHEDQPVESGDNVLVLSDSVVGPPADVRATVKLIAGADSSMRASWVWSIQPRPIPLTVDIGCLEKHKPEILVKSLPWVKVSQIKAEMDPDVCSHEASHKSHGVGWYALRGGVILGAFVAGRATSH